MTDSNWEEGLEKRLKEMERRLEEMGRRIGDEVEEHLRGKIYHYRSRSHGAFWGLMFIIIGLVWLGRSVGWFDIDIPFWPTALIVIGLYMVYNASRRKIP